jgi:hypothetical protein
MKPSISARMASTRSVALSHTSRSSELGAPLPPEPTWAVTLAKASVCSFSASSYSAHMCVHNSNWHTDLLLRTVVVLLRPPRLALASYAASACCQQ